MIVTVTIDTEEDDWGSYAPTGAGTDNIQHLRYLQDTFDQYGARPTYLVNRPPLLDHASVEVLGSLASRDDVEIGGHCHPWNTPPYPDEGGGNSMMCAYSQDTNRAKIREVTSKIVQELGTRPRSFRAGRWGYGPTVASALLDEGYEIDCSVSPLIDWSSIGGPDFQNAPHRPYRFEPSAPFQADPEGRMLELPTTIGFLRGDRAVNQRRRDRLERSALARFKIVGVLDRAGLLARRWLSPETSTAGEMIRVAESARKAGETYISMTFHSCTLLPGATPFVADTSDRARFLEHCRRFFSYCSDSGYEFRTLSEAGREPGLTEP